MNEKAPHSDLCGAFSWVPQRRWHSAARENGQRDRSDRERRELLLDLGQREAGDGRQTIDEGREVLALDQR